MDIGKFVAISPKWTCVNKLNLRIHKLRSGTTKLLMQKEYVSNFHITSLTLREHLNKL
jgi:hypothetical protein